LSGTLYIYADDVLLLNAHNINEETNDIINRDVSKIIDFFKYKRLLINKVKTTYMIIHRPYQNIHDGDEILIENHFSMKRTKYAKYLGLVIDENLNFEELVLKYSIPYLLKLRIWSIPLHLNGLFDVTSGIRISFLHDFPMNFFKNTANSFSFMVIASKKKHQ